MPRPPTTAAPTATGLTQVARLGGGGGGAIGCGSAGAAALGRPQTPEAALAPAAPTGPAAAVAANWPAPELTTEQARPPSAEMPRVTKLPTDDAALEAAPATAPAAEATPEPIAWPARFTAVTGFRSLSPKPRLSSASLVARGTASG